MNTTLVRPSRLLDVIVLSFLLIPIVAQSDTLPVEFDFTNPDAASEWGQPHHISSLNPTSDGLEITIDGNDPYFHGPTRNYPDGTPLWVTTRLRSEQPGTAEIFYFRDHARAGDSVQFVVPEGRWIEARVPLPPLGPNYKLRFDPPGISGKITLASIRVEHRLILAEPTWPKWTPPEPGTRRELTSGDLAVYSSAATPLAFELRVRSQSMAFAHPTPRIGYIMGDEVRWVSFSDTSVERSTATGATFSLTARNRDADGAVWTYRQTFSSDPRGAIAAETTVVVDQDRSVVYLPMQLLIAGERSFGSAKTQGLFAGLEYLDDEPSSSEADIIGPESNRRVPASHKITFPLMAIAATNHYVGLIWEHSSNFSALFDSPDRTFGTQGHVMGVLFPGSDGVNRAEGNLLPYGGQLLPANQQLTSRAWFIGGSGRSIVPAVQQYVNLRGLPDVPNSALTFANYVELAARGWLESKCREGNLYRHAVWPGFNAQPAGDAALFQSWLASHAEQSEQATRLEAAAKEAITAVEPRHYYHSAIGHVRTPATPLVFGGVREAVSAARQIAQSQLARFADDGSVPYRSSKNIDYGKTHFEPDANGLTAQVVMTLLHSAAFCGDRNLIAQAVEKLHALDKFRYSVPRGAQTWEVPLHTPDILASAHLVRAYTLGYQLTGERKFLEQAIDWAWTGVPFVYLVNPTGQPVGPYSTIAVFGATSWKAPVWFGRPVQWCGLVYADALYHLASIDIAGPWKKLADGITSAGLQHTWPIEDAERVGLLPDFFELQPQVRAGPAINPATVGINAIRMYGREPIHEFHIFRQNRLIVHAPGGIASASETEQGVKFTVRGWPKGDYFVLANGCTNKPSVKVNGAAATHEFHATEGLLILQVSGTATIEITDVRIH